LRKKIAVLALSAAVSSFGFIGAAPPAQACAEFDPTIGCIGACARPLQGSPTCPTPTDDGNGKGNGDKP
jgi:hypothetical protein